MVYGHAENSPPINKLVSLKHKNTGLLAKYFGVWFGSCCNQLNHCNPNPINF